MEKSRAPPAVGGQGAGSLAVYDLQLSHSSHPSGSGVNPTSSVGPKSLPNLPVMLGLVAILASIYYGLGTVAQEKVRPGQ